MYVISKQLSVDVFGVRAKGYVEDLKGHVKKSLALQALQNCRIALKISTIDQWNARNLGLPYYVKYPTIIYVIYLEKEGDAF